jgi:hypothetical protein
MIVEIDMNIQMIITYIVGLLLFLILMSVLVNSKDESGAKPLAKVRVPVKKGSRRIIEPDDRDGDQSTAIIPWDWIIAAVIAMYFITVLAVAR